MSVIPCVTWVKRGKPKQRPEKIQIQKEDLKRIIEETEDKLEEEEEGPSEDEAAAGGDSTADVADHDASADIELAKEMAQKLHSGTKKKKNNKKKNKYATGPAENDDDFESRYNLDDYDDEDAKGANNPLKGLGNLTVYASNTDDPYVSIKEDESDEEDVEIKPTDNLLLVARADSDCCSMEVHVYNAELGNLYCHHDILLGNFPLAVEWMDYDLRDGNAGNYVAIATMDPTIDIWDLDLIDSLEPMATLGRKVKSKKKAKIPSHTDAVLDLSWNPLARHVLASASADFTVGLWDLTEGKLSLQIREHKEKVQCIQWHNVEEHMLLSGSFDKTVKMYDCRDPTNNHKTWNLGGEIEKLLWNPFNPFNFFASTDTGNVFSLDCRQDKSIYTLAAHTQSVTGLNMSSEDARLLVTTSSDGSIKFWDIENDQPSLVSSKKLSMGQLLSLDSCPDAGYVFAMGGERSFKIWDTREIKDVFTHFCGTADEHIADTRPEEKEDPEAAMEVEEIQGAMGLDTIENEAETVPQNTNNSSDTTAKWKKPKKKKKKNRKP